MQSWVMLAGGALLLYFGAEWFVGGASALARSLRVPPIVIGLTVVAYGTSAPEVIVGLQAARSGHGAVALGNVIGSNIANIGLILALCALVRPARVHGDLRRRELPTLALTALAVPLALADGRVSRFEGVVLLLAAVGYTGWMVVGARADAIREAREGARATAEATQAAGAPEDRGGLGVLLVGGQLFVTGAVQVAQRLGVSERVIGLTLVAVGTSLPELVTGLLAARKGHGDIVVGNVIGSNIFNVLLCLGASASARGIAADRRALWLDLATLLAMTAAALWMLRRERDITRAEGAAALALYVAYLAVTASGGP